MEEFDLDNICICGHTLNYHWVKDLPFECVQTIKCQCKIFKLDNLKYLEMLSKEKEVADL